MYKALNARDLFLLDLALGQGADLEARAHGDTPLLRAACRDFPAGLKLLLDLGANPNARDDDGWSAAMWSASLDRVDALTALKERGANFDLAGRDGRCPAAEASCQGSMRALAFLIAQSVDLNRRDAFGQTVTELAIDHGQIEALKLLADAGALLPPSSRLESVDSWQGEAFETDGQRFRAGYFELVQTIVCRAQLARAASEAPTQAGLTARSRL
jgi:ankyrin repeat protein